MINIINKLKINLTIIHLAILPIALILGNFAINLYLYSLVFFVLINIFYTKNWEYFKNQENKIIITFYLAWLYLILISIFIHDHNVKNISKAILFGLNFIFALGLSNLLLDLDKKQLKTISIIFFGITLFIYFDLIYQFFNSEYKDIFGFEVNNLRELKFFGKDVILATRLSGPFKDELVPGFYLATFGCVSIFLMFSLVYPLKYKLLVFFLFINLSIIILTGERSSIIMNFVTLFLFFLFRYKFNFTSIINIFFLFFILIFLINFNPTTKNRFNDLVYWTTAKWSVEEVSKDIKKKGISETLNYKDVLDNVLKTPWMEHYKTSIKMINKKPLFGTGIRSFRSECKKYNEKSCATHPHHYILEIISETGLIFFLLLSGLIYFILNEAWKNKQKNLSFNLGIIFIFISYLFPLRPTGSFFSSWHGSFFWILLAFLFFSNKILIKKND